VDNRARVCVRQNYYSVPARYASRRLNVRLSAIKVEVLDGPRLVAVHERAAGKYAEVLTLDHYLDVLKYKPGATALAQARAAGAFTASHQRYWDAARRARGDANGTRAMTEVLLGHRTLPADALIRAMDRAVTSGALDRRPSSPAPAGWPAARSPPSSRSARWPATTGPPRPWTATTPCCQGAPGDRRVRHRGAGRDRRGRPRAQAADRPRRRCPPG